VAGRIGSARVRGTLAGIARNAYLRLFLILVVVAAGAAALTVGIGIVLDIVVPLIFGSELHALAALFPGLGR
jgi:hypothetical protein